MIYFRRQGLDDLTSLSFSPSPDAPVLEGFFFHPDFLNPSRALVRFRPFEGILSVLYPPPPHSTRSGISTATDPSMHLHTTRCFPALTSRSFDRSLCFLTAFPPTLSGGIRFKRHSTIFLQGALRHFPILQSTLGIVYWTLFSFGRFDSGPLGDNSLYKELTPWSYSAGACPKVGTTFDDSTLDGSQIYPPSRILRGQRPGTGLL